MIKAIWKKIKIWCVIHFEYRKISFAKDKWIYSIPVLTLCIFLSLKFLENNWERIIALYENTTLVGVLGTLLGAVIGGIFSLAGSISVGRHQIKVQTQIRRKNVIYKLLYDELYDIHNHILVENPYPARIEFESKQQTITKHPQYAAWGRIKADSRYLETPKKLANLLDQLEVDVREYLKAREKAGTTTMLVLNEILEQEADVKCNIVGLDGRLLRCVLSDCSFDLFEEIHHLYEPRKDLDEEIKQKVQKRYIDECSVNGDIIDLVNKRKEWLNTEESAIALLAAMIRYIIVRYEE